MDFVIQPFHRFRPWWHRIMDEHRNRKVAISELCRDHAQMFPNCLLAVGIGWVVAGNFDPSCALDMMIAMKARKSVVRICLFRPGERGEPDRLSDPSFMAQLSSAR
jgi:hypothetical protein